MEDKKEPVKQPERKDVIIIVPTPMQGTIKAGGK